MSLVKELAELAETLINTKDFTSYEAFLAIDVNNFKYIEYSNLLNYLGKNGYNVREEEACSIIYRLDTDNDERISYDEFQQIFFPISYYGGVVKRDNTDYESAVDFKKEEFRDENEVSYEVNRDLAESNNFNRSDFDNQAKDTGLSYQRSPRPEVSTGTSFYRARKNYTSSVSPIRPALKYDYTLSPNRPREIVSSSRRLYSPEKTKYAEKTLYSPYRVNLTKSPERQRYISPNRTNRTNRSPLTRSECSPKISRMPETSYLKNKTNSSLIAKYFYEILSLDLNAESLKEALSVKSDINIRDLFNYFDLTGRSYISLVDMKEVLKELDIFANLDNIKLLYKRFDKDLDGRLE
jgi:Ca2+-binding EF-hand superfamily protein